MYSIYFIECPQCEATYVGKTKNIEKRERKHRTNTFDPRGHPYNRKIYKHFRDCGLESNDICCQPLVEIDNADEASKVEREYINSIGDLNMLHGIMHDPNFYPPSKLEANRRYEATHRLERLEKARERYKIKSQNLNNVILHNG